jgi:hypothetical protein
MLASFTHLPIADVRTMQHTPPAFFMPWATVSRPKASAG